MLLLSRIEGSRVNSVHVLQILHLISRTNVLTTRMHECHHHPVSYREPSQTGLASLLYSCIENRVNAVRVLPVFMDHSILMSFLD